MPPQTLSAGDRVELRYDSDGYNFLRAGLRGTVVGYATPDIQRRQVWPEELCTPDRDTPDSIGASLMSIVSGSSVVRASGATLSPTGRGSQWSPAR